MNILLGGKSLRVCWQKYPVLKLSSMKSYPLLKLGVHIDTRRRFKVDTTSHDIVARIYVETTSFVYGEKA